MSEIERALIYTFFFFTFPFDICMAGLVKRRSLGLFYVGPFTCYRLSFLRKFHKFRPTKQKDINFP
jgi:hypothetical protein